MSYLVDIKTESRRWPLSCWSQQFNEEVKHTINKNRPNNFGKRLRMRDCKMEMERKWIRTVIVCDVHPEKVSGRTGTLANPENGKLHTHSPCLKFAWALSWVLALFIPQGFVPCSRHCPRNRELPQGSPSCCFSLLRKGVINAQLERCRDSGRI